MDELFAFLIEVVGFAYKIGAFLFLCALPLNMLVRVSSGKSFFS